MFTILFNKEIQKRKLFDIPLENYLNIKLPPGYYENTFDLIKGLNTQLEINTFSHLNIYLVDDIFGEPIGEDITKLKIENCRLHLRPNLKYKKAREFFEGIKFVVFNKKLLSILDMPPRKIDADSAQFSILDIEKVTLKDFKPPLNRLFHMYTNIIKHQHLGSHQDRLLRSFVLKKESNKHLYLEFIHPHYVAVEDGHYKYIQIDIKDDNNTFASFGEGSLLIKLHFKRVGDD